MNTSNISPTTPTPDSSVTLEFPGFHLYCELVISTSFKNALTSVELILPGTICQFSISYSLNAETLNCLYQPLLNILSPTLTITLVVKGF